MYEDDNISRIDTLKYLYTKRDTLEHNVFMLEIRLKEMQTEYDETRGRLKGINEAIKIVDAIGYANEEEMQG